MPTTLQLRTLNATSLAANTGAVSELVVDSEASGGRGGLTLHDGTTPGGIAVNFFEESNSAPWVYLSNTMQVLVFSDANTHNILPQANATYDLGSEDRYWGNVYVENLFTANGSLSGNYVEKSGDTMTGTLNAESIIPTSDDTFTLGNSTAGFSDLYLSGNTFLFNDSEISAYDGEFRIEANGSLQFDGILNNANNTSNVQSDIGINLGVENSTVTGNYSSILGGSNNQVHGEHSIVFGKNHNSSGNNSGIFVGENHYTSANFSFISSGSNNRIEQEYSSIIGGKDNLSNGYFSFVFGGEGSVANNDYTFAFGPQVIVNHKGSYIFNDSSNTELSSDANDQVKFAASGGFWLGGDANTKNILPQTTATYDIGTTSNRYNDLFLANSIAMGDNTYVNFGSTLGDSGYGFRDNEGTIQFKNDSGSWTDVGSGLVSDDFVNTAGDTMTGNLVSVSIIPVADDTHDLGNSTSGFSNVYVSNNVVFNGDVEITTSNSTTLSLVSSGDVSANCNQFIIDNGFLKFEPDGTGTKIEFFSSAYQVGINAFSLQIQSDKMVHIGSDQYANAFMFDADDREMRVPGNCYVNFGDTEGESGYGFRDDNGTLQFKNDGGTWANVGSGDSGSGGSPGDTALFGGGWNAAFGAEINNIDQLTMSTTGNSTDFGDLNGTNTELGGCSNGATNRGVFAGGRAGSHTNRMEYVDISTPGNATDFGDLTLSRRLQTSATDNGTNDRGVFATGEGASSTNNNIDYVTISTTGNATDFGDTTVAWRYGSACSNDTSDRGIFWAGLSQNVINYITITSTGNATDFGDGSLTAGRAASTSNGGNNRGVVGGYQSSNTMEYITINSTGNSTDFGDQSQTRHYPEAVSNKSSERGIWASGYTSSGQNTIDYITINSTGNATDFGDLTSGRSNPGGMSNA